MGKREKASILIGGLLVVVAMFFCAGDARSEYPERNITIMVAMAPGGPTDILTRALAAGAEKELGKPLVIENKDGGGGSVALSLAANVPPDGYTVCAALNVAVVDTPLMQKVAYRPLKSFTPIMAHSLAEHTALIVKKDAPWKTFEELIAFAKSNPGKIKYSTAGVGTGMHVAMEVIARKDGIKWIHVPYKGTAPAVTALLGGHVDVCSAGVGWQIHEKSGSIRALADHAKKRSADYPNVPTLFELGYGFSNETIHGILGPAGLPPAVVKRLQEAFRKGTETPAFKTAQEQLFTVPVDLDAQAWGKHLRDRWTSVEKTMMEVGIITGAATNPE
jgi:tripartite-type tricarboxylate transporter receptor subunit TctC